MPRSLDDELLIEVNAARQVLGLDPLTAGLFGKFFGGGMSAEELREKALKQKRNPLGRFAKGGAKAEEELREGRGGRLDVTPDATPDTPKPEAPKSSWDFDVPEAPEPEMQEPRREASRPQMSDEERERLYSESALDEEQAWIDRERERSIVLDDPPWGNDVPHGPISGWFERIEQYAGEQAGERVKNAPDSAKDRVIRQEQEKFLIRSRVRAHWDTGYREQHRQNVQRIEQRWAEIDGAAPSQRGARDGGIGSNLPRNVAENIFGPSGQGQVRPNGMEDRGPRYPGRPPEDVIRPGLRRPEDVPGLVRPPDAEPRPRQPRQPRQPRTPARPGKAVEREKKEWAIRRDKDRDAVAEAVRHDIRRPETEVHLHETEQAKEGRWSKLEKWYEKQLGRPDVTEQLKGHRTDESKAYAESIMDGLDDDPNISDEDLARRAYASYLHRNASRMVQSKTNWGRTDPKERRYLPEDHAKSWDELDPKERERDLDAVKKAREALDDRRADDTAAALHDLWRESRSRGDGTFEPHVEEDEDGAIDLANTPYDKLPDKWKAQLKEDSKVVNRLIDENPKAHDDWYAGRVHDAWRARNLDTISDEENVPFAQLSKEAKDQNRVVVREAMKIREERERARKYRRDARRGGPRRPRPAA